MALKINTTTLKNGIKVLASRDKAGYFGPQTYMNTTQATNKISELQAQGIDAQAYYTGRVTYISIKN